MSYFDFEITDENPNTVKQKTKRGAPAKYPFDQLGVNQSFKIPMDASIQSLRCLAYSRGVDQGKKFTVSKKEMKVIRTAQGFVMKISAFGFFCFAINIAMAVLNFSVMNGADYSFCAGLFSFGIAFFVLGWEFSK